MSFEKTSHDPLADRVTDRFDQFFNSGFVVGGDSENSLEEELVEGVQGVLIHMGNDIELNAEEVKHGSFGGDSSVELSGKIDFDFGDFGLFLLNFNFRRSLFGDV